jgi:preprotein translocase subunit SecD
MNKVLRKVLLIFTLASIATYISLPSVIPVRISFANLNIEKDLIRPDLNISIGNINIRKNFDLVLGLDLAGGSHLVFEADTEGIPEDRRRTAIDGVKEVIERRVNLFGVSEPNVQTSSFAGRDRIIVELPGVRDTQEAVDLIGKTAQLVFAELGNEEEPGLFPTELTGADLRRADVSFDTTTGKPVVVLEFTEEGSQKFAQLTEVNIGKPLAIMLDENLVSAPVVQDRIIGGTAQITGDFSLDEAKNLAIQLNAGALPVSVELVEQRTVGATLGAESVEKSIQAGLVGLVMVLLFMILTYGRFGVVASIALLIFGVLTLALYKLIPVVLTLPGIAGFLLSVGMAVDSNILIFERFKEEKLRRDFANALEISFGRAWNSIRDANIATLITAFVLANPLDWGFLHVSGPVRGFAITLAIGVGVSMFTGIVVTRNLLRAFVKDSTKSKVRSV